jgi:purine catabolism regulator
MIGLTQLTERLGPGLQPAGATRVVNVQLTGVHISELDDPTPYLEGGELLLTTGIPLGGSDSSLRDYVDRLRQRGILALGLGLGAGTDTLPAGLEAACTDAGLQLLIVPEGTPFMHISRAYWDLVGKTAQADLAASLSLQTSLAQAATRPEAVAAVVKVLSTALGGWAVYLPADGTAETVWPPIETRVLGPLREETKRLGLAGTRSAATFAMLGRDVLEYSIIDGTRTAGFLAVCAGRPLRAADRNLIITGCLLLAVTAQREWQLTRANSIVNNTAATLILNGFVDAARVVAGTVAGPPLADRVRVIALRGENLESTTTAELAERFGSVDGGLLRSSLRQARLRNEIDGVTYLLVETFFGIADAGTLSAATGAAGIAMAISDPMLLSEVRPALAQLRRAVLAAPLGGISAGSSQLDPRVAAWVQALTDYSRADLISTVTTYLRHRGQWEPAARELGVHRNSLRHRMTIVATLLEADVNDPDVAANLWLALRPN